MGGKRKWSKGHRGTHVTSEDSRFDDQVRAEVDLLFQKKFSYERENGDEWIFPNCPSFENEPWQDSSLIALKEKLNSVKSSLSDVDISKWHDHTQRTNRAGQVMHHIRCRCRPELCTQAWCKFHEIVAQFPLIPQEEAVINSLHLCEAPGAFITSLNHYLCDAGFNGFWNWMGNTLNPYYEGNGLSEMIDDDRLIIDTIEKWHFGADNTGNIMSPGYLRDLKGTLNFMQPLNLVTADGSIDCQNMPDQQEAVTAQLHFCEAVLAMNVLAQGGSLVLKMFTMFEHQSICLLYLLNLTFNKVTVVKPATSKPGNSEVYVVCLNYRANGKEFLESATSCIGQSNLYQALFDRDSIPASFLIQHRACCEFFTKHQINTIEENKRLFENMSTEINQRMDLVREYCAISYQERFNIKHLNTQHYVVPQFETIGKCKQQRLSSNRAKGRHTGSYNARIDYSRMTLVEKLRIMKKYHTAKLEILWFSSPYTLEDSDCSSWKVVDGEPLHRVNCSRFISNELLKQYYELRDGINGPSESTQVKTITKKLCDCNICHGLGDKPRDTTSCTCDPETDCLTERQVDRADNTVENFAVEKQQCAITVDCTSVYQQLLLEMKIYSKNIQLETETVRSSSCSLYDFLSAKMEGNEEASEGDEQINLVMVQQINENDGTEFQNRMWDDFYTQFKKMNKGDHFLLPLSNAWSRFSAGIIYTLYATFSKIGTFVSHENNKRWYVGLNHTGCPTKLLEHLDQVDKAMLNSSSTSVLQFVPMHNLLESNFHSLLSTANNMDLKTSINDLLDQCRVLHDQR